jgi:AcrR family transcriptional regulator
MAAEEDSANSAQESASEIARRKLIDAGCELVLEHYEHGTHLREVYSYLNAGAVSKRAGMSRGLLYHYWGDGESSSSSAFESYLGSVSDQLLERSSIPDDLVEMASFLGSNMTDMILEITAAELERTSGEDAPLWSATEMLALHGLSTDSAAEELLNKLDGFWTVGLAQVAREPLPPLGYRELSIAASNLITGFASPVLGTHERLWKEYDWPGSEERESSTRPWTLLAIAMESLILCMTRPVK